MADKEIIKKETENENGEVVRTEKVTKSESVNAAVAGRPSRKFIWTIIISIVVLYLIIVIIGSMIFHAARQTQTTGANGNSTSSAQRFGRPGMSGMSGDRTYNVSQSNSDGLTTTTTNTTYTQTQGVITAVNSDNVVVAGGGKTQTIKTNSSTTYVGDTKPAVNDTVVIVGTKDGDTITATQVQVYNY